MKFIKNNQSNIYFSINSIFKPSFKSIEKSIGLVVLLMGSIVYAPGVLASTDLELKPSSGLSVGGVNTTFIDKESMSYLPSNSFLPFTSSVTPTVSVLEERMSKTLLEKDNLDSQFLEDRKDEKSEEEESEGEKKLPPSLKKISPLGIANSQLNKLNKYGRVEKIRWEVSLKNLDDNKLLQKTSFNTDADVKKLPFLVYEQEQASAQNNTASVKESIKTQFDLETSEPVASYRITRIIMTSGKMSVGQKVNEKEETLSNTQLTGVSNKATFVHTCDNTSHTLLFQKILLEIKCNK